MKKELVLHRFLDNVFEVIKESVQVMYEFDWGGKRWKFVFFGKLSPCKSFPHYDGEGNENEREESENVIRKISFEREKFILLPSDFQHFKLRHWFSLMERIFTELDKYRVQEKISIRDFLKRDVGVERIKEVGENEDE